jgi:hypothetical protein
MESSPERGNRKRGRGACLRGGHGWGEELQEGVLQGGSASVRALCCVSFAVREKKQEGGRREEKRKKRREEREKKRRRETRRKKRKEFFSKLGNF